MRRNENKDYGKIIDYDPQWKGPLDIEREQTDFGFLISFGIYLAVWIGVGIYALCTGEVKINHNSGSGYPSTDTIVVPESINSAMYISLGFIILGIVLSFIYLFLLRHFPKTVVFTAIFAICVALLVTIGVLAYFVATSKQNTSGAIAPLVVSIIMFIIIIICLIVYRKKVVIACGVVKESTKAVMSFPSSFLFPIFPFILYGISIAFTGCTFMYLSGNRSLNSGDKTPVLIYVFHGINFFGLLWSTNFIYAFSQMVLSGTFATWYWTMNKERVPSHTILKFMRVTSRFHLGTLAFGSLIIAIVEAIKALLRALSQRSRDSGNDIVALLFSCFGSMCGALENLLEYINTNAYIMCTMHGTRFYQSAKDAFNLLMRNVMNIVVVTNVTGAILFLGTLLVVGFSVLGAFLYCRNMENSVRTTAMIIVAISTLIMSVSIFEVLKTAINTIFLCVLEDYERNDGSSERPYFMPYKLRALLIQDV